MSEEQEYYEITDPAEAVGLGLLGKEIERFYGVEQHWINGILRMVADVENLCFGITTGRSINVYWFQKIRIPHPTVDDLKEGDVIRYKRDNYENIHLAVLNYTNMDGLKIDRCIQDIELHTGSSWIPLKAGRA